MAKYMFHAINLFILFSFFRYGREDEELMGLRFCNEVVVAAEQIYPTGNFTHEVLSSLLIFNYLRELQNWE